MLLVIGKTLEVSSRHVTPAGQPPFDVRVVHLLLGKSRVEYVDLAKDFRGDVPNEGDEVALEVSVRAYVAKSGKASHGYVAWENKSADVKVASPARG